MIKLLFDQVKWYAYTILASGLDSQLQSKLKE
jgi:hypothetical protein